MKKLFLIFAYIFIPKLFFAQTKDLPDCKTVKKEIAEVHNSFDNIVEKFRSKEDKVSLVKTYFSDFSICSEKGKIKDYGRSIEFMNFYKRVFKKLKDEFATTHVYKVSKEQSAKSSYFYEKDKGMTSSKRNIKLLLSYKDPVDKTTAYSVSLIFEYYPKR